jgi:hypothetical protein
VIERLKSFGIRIWDKILDHLAGYIALIILAVIATTYIIFSEWLKSKHTFEMYGLLWVMSAVGIALFPFILYWLLTRTKILYEDEDDIKNILRKWWRHCTDSRGTKKFTIYFDSVDKRESLKKGSSAKFLPSIIEENGKSHVINIGKRTMLVEYQGKQIKRKSGFLDNLY